MAAAPFAACGDDEVVFEGTATARPVTSTSATPDRAPDLYGFIYPIAGACMPQDPNLMPNAPRAYRSGVHEGVDFYDSDNCTSIQPGTPVVAAKAGAVARVDHAYHDLTQDELEQALARIRAGGADDFDVVDLFRGRQVWIDHGGGVITRYAHLAGVAADLVEGARVAQGETIGFVGDSGTPESVPNPGSETHLHWEVVVDGVYLGRGLADGGLRALYESLFEAEP